MQRREPAASAPELFANALNALKIVRKHWAVLLACVITSAGISLVYTKSQTRIYQATSMIELSPNAYRPIASADTNMPMGPGDFLDNREYYETQYRLIISSKVLSTAARDSGLQNDFEFFGLKSPPATPFTAEQAGDVLRGSVSVDPVRNSRLVNIRVEDASPDRARRLANAVATAYIDQNLQKAINATSDSVTWLETQVANVRKELDADENALSDFKKEHQLPSTSINETSNMVRAEMQDFNTSLTKTRTRRQELLARRAELSKLLEENPSLDALSSSELLTNEFFQRLRSDFQESVRIRREMIAQGKGAEHPLVKAADERILGAQESMRAELKNILGAIARDLAVIETQEKGEAALYGESHHRAVELTMREIEYHRLDRSRDQNEKLYAMLLEHLKEADLARMMKVNNIHLVETAKSPGAPIRPRAVSNIAGGSILGFLLGVGLVFVRHTLDSTLKTPDDVESHLGVPFLGLLPSIEDDEEGGGRKKRRRRKALKTPATGVASELVVHQRPLSGIAEAARTIRTNLLFTNPDKPYRRLLVTSSAPSEGKTTVACSIAIALAQSGQRVCIIDCDLRRPRLHRIFGRAGDAGVTNVLVGEVSVDAVARPTEVENLWCIPSGPTPPNPADLLHSARFRAFLDEVSSKFDRVIIDSPPVVAVTDSAIISTIADATIFVLRAFSTTRALSRQGMRALTDVDANIAGAVLNRVDLSRNDYSYYQYYYYKKEGYGPLPSASDDGGHGEDSASPPPS